MSFAHQSGAGGVSVHGLLSGLDADDHLWAARADKTRPDPWVEAADLAGRSLADLGTRLHSDLNNLAYADAGHTGFCSLATAQTITAQKLIDSAVGLRFGHAAGPLLQGPASGDILALTGSKTVSGRLTVGDTTINTTDWLRVSPPALAAGIVHRIINLAPNAAVALLGLRIIDFNLGAGLTIVNGGGFAGLNSASGLAINPAAATSAIQGLAFQMLIMGGGGGATVTDLDAIYARTGALSFTGTITRSCGLRLDSPYILGATPSIPNYYGAHITNALSNKVVNAYGIYMNDITNATGNRYLLELGPATPNLRLIANAPPNAGLADEGDSQMFLAWMENGAVNLRRVRWRQQSSLLATDKVCIAA